MPAIQDGRRRLATIPAPVKKRYPYVDGGELAV
jgi:hypothetical protein